jgi:hypothetical protein
MWFDAWANILTKKNGVKIALPDHGSKLMMRLQPKQVCSTFVFRITDNYRLRRMPRNG